VGRVPAAPLHVRSRAEVAGELFPHALAVGGPEADVAEQAAILENSQEEDAEDELDSRLAAPAVQPQGELLLASLVLVDALHPARQARRFLDARPDAVGEA